MSNVTTVPIEIVDKATGHVSIMHFVTEERDGTTGKVRWQRAAPDDAIEAELVKSGQALDSVTWRRIDPTDIPVTRDFRNCWRSNGAKIAVDMPLARDEHMANIRRARDAMLAKKDGEWVKEFSRGNQAMVDAIEAERQKLRDVPQTIDAGVRDATTPEALKAMWPADLD